MASERKCFEHGDLTFSYLDAGGDGEPFVALHAHWMEAATFRLLAELLAPRYRVIALDQRGHGYSSHAPTYRRDDYAGDLDAFFDRIRLGTPAVLLGNSLGGINALQFAAKRPERVRALILEDIAAEVDTDLSFVRAWAGTFPTREALEERVGARMLPYLANSFRETARGWRLAFEPEDMIRSQASLNGSYWTEFCSIAAPTLIVHGRDSNVTKREQFDEMIRRRPQTRFEELAGGHVVHQDSPQAFADAIRRFLA